GPGYPAKRYPRRDQREADHADPRRGRHRARQEGMVRPFGRDRPRHRAWHSQSDATGGRLRPTQALASAGRRCQAGRGRTDGGPGAAGEAREGMAAPVTPRKVVRAHLLADPQVAALVGDRIYYHIRPDGAEYPCIVLTTISDVPQRDLQGRAWTDTRIQLTVMSQT